MKKVIVIDKIVNCPKCNELMERRKHKTITPKMLRKEYYFTEWDVCRKCHHIQLYEEYKQLTSTIVIKMEEELNALEQRLFNIS
jgi:uncharacterized protein with PIN domain